MAAIKKILLTVFFFASTCLVVEVFIHFSHIADTARNDFHDEVGHGLRKDHQFVLFAEGFGLRSTNKDGFLGPDVTLEKPENTIRIALLGDSYVESVQVFERDYFGELCKGKLGQEFPDKNVEVLNFGLSGVDIADMYAYHKNMAEKYNPDYYLYMVSNADLVPKYRDPLRPNTVLEGGLLKIDMNFKKSSTFQTTIFLTQNSHIFYILNNCRLKVKEVPLAEILLDKLYYIFKPQTQATQIHPFEIIDEIPPVTQKIMETIDPNKIIVINRDTNSIMPQFVALCNQNNINFICLSEHIKELNLTVKDICYWNVTKNTGHWNLLGHKVVGDIVAKEISNVIEN